MNGCVRELIFDLIHLNYRDRLVKHAIAELNGNEEVIEGKLITSVHAQGQRVIKQNE